jgi:hypothetical protein
VRGALPPQPHTLLWRGALVTNTFISSEGSEVTGSWHEIICLLRENRPSTYVAYVCITSDSTNAIQQDVMNECLYRNPNLYAEMFRVGISRRRRAIWTQFSRDFSQFLRRNARMAN